MAKNPRLIDLTGQHFGHWTVLHQAGNTPRGGALWMSRCDCGETRPVLGADLRAGKSVSCGCYNVDRLGTQRRTHGGSGTRLYNIWQQMRARCHQVSNPRYKEWGGRGITICPEWNDFPTFRDWALSAGYRDDLSIERVDVNGNYEPSNCTWADAATQSANRNYTQKAPDGQLWLHKARANGISGRTFHVRKSAGWPEEQAATWPKGKRRPPDLR